MISKFLANIFHFARIIARFCKFQKLSEKERAKNRLKEGSKGADVNEGKFVLNIDFIIALNI
jgi:hypothetical protein